MIERVIGRDVGIGLRVPDIDVDPVENARELVAEAAQHAVEAVAEFRRANYFRVRRAYGRDMVGKDHAGLEHRKPAEKFDMIRRPPRRRQIQVVEIIVREITVVGEVMDREYGRGRVVHHAQKGRYEPGLPVMRMHHVRPPVAARYPARQQGHGTAEHGVAFGIVRPGIAVRVYIRVARPVEQGGHVDQVQVVAENVLVRLDDMHLVPAACSGDIDRTEILE